LIRELKAQQAAAIAMTPPCCDPVDPLTALQNEVATLRAKVAELERELAEERARNVATPPHLWKVEKRA